jgi:uridine kinase
LRSAIVVRLLLSVNRTGTLTDALEVVELAGEYAGHIDPVVVGLDFSGNPTKGDFSTFVPAFDRARALGLPISFHIAEVDNPAEVSAMLTYAQKGDRFGHALKLSAAQRSQLQASRIPIEICPTSNLRTLELTRYEDHPTLPHWLATAHPIALCTDDRGVFQCSLTSEYLNVVQALKLSRVDICRIARLALLFTFSPRSSQAWQQAERLSTEKLAALHAQNEVPSASPLSPSSSPPFKPLDIQKAHTGATLSGQPPYAIAVFGASCCGKTTLCSDLAARFPMHRMKVLHADDFRAYTLFGYRHVDPNTRLRNWEHPANAAWNGLLSAVLQSQENLRQAAAPSILIVEGHMLMQDPRLVARMDACIWIDIDRETCRRRRFARPGSSPAPAGWDQDAYFDQCLWAGWEEHCHVAETNTRALDARGALMHLDGAREQRALSEDSVRWLRERIQCGGMTGAKM